jgi:anti-sigma B factor antagonist
MEVTMTEYNDVTIVTLKGEFGGDSADIVQDALNGCVRPRCKIVLDLDAVPFLSSAGLRVLLVTYRDVQAQEGHIVLARVEQHLQHVMDATGFLQYFTITDTVDNGITLLEQAL